MAGWCCTPVGKGDLDFGFSARGWSKLVGLCAVAMMLGVLCYAVSLTLAAFGRCYSPAAVGSRVASDCTAGTQHWQPCMLPVPSPQCPAPCFWHLFDSAEMRTWLQGVIVAGPAAEIAL